MLRLGLAVSAGVKLFVIYLLIGMSLPETWPATLETVKPGDPRFFMGVMGGSLIFAMIIWRVPEFTASMLGARAGFGMEWAYSDSK